MQDNSTPSLPNSTCSYCGNPFHAHYYRGDKLTRFCSARCVNKGKHGRTLALDTPCDMGDGSAVVFLGNARFSMIDADDIERVSAYAWRLSSAKDRPDYASTTVSHIQIYLHRFVINAPSGTLVDHQDRDGLNNRKGNIRIATATQNMANTIKRATNTNTYKGVRLRHDGKKWCARVQINGKGVHLGSFDTQDEAARAYDKKALELFQEFAVLNFPDDHDRAA